MCGALLHLQVCSPAIVAAAAQAVGMQKSFIILEWNVFARSRFAYDSQFHYCSSPLTTTYSSVKGCG